MKDVGAAIGMGSKIAKGEVEFNAIAANLVLRTMHSAALGFGYMFPEGSETGADTEASPAIWSDRAGFDAAVAPGFLVALTASAAFVAGRERVDGGLVSPLTASARSRVPLPDDHPNNRVRRLSDRNS